MRVIYDQRPTGIRAYIGKLILIGLGPNVKSFPSYSPYPRRDGQAKFTWVAGYIIKWFQGACATRKLLRLPSCCMLNGGSVGEGREMSERFYI